MMDEHRLFVLEEKYKKISGDFDILQDSISHLPIIILICFLSGLTVGILVSFLF